MRPAFSSLESYGTFDDQRTIVRTEEFNAFAANDQVSSWRNEDLDPVPEDQKTWEWYHVGGFWVVNGFTAANIQTASANVALGLNPGLIMVAYLIGIMIVGVACAGSGYIGTKYSINYPVITRASFGMWGSYLPIVIRAAYGPIWYGIGTYLGSLALQAMIEAIWPSFSTWRQDALPASAGITAVQLLCFSICWLASVPLIFVSLSFLRWVFLVKIIIMSILVVSLFVWAATASHGLWSLLSIPSKMEDGTSVPYAICYAMDTAMSGCGSFVLNIPDILRYANKPHQTTIANAIALPVSMTLIYFLGVVLAASSQLVYGQVIWNPLQIILLWDNRAAKFFAGLLFTLAIMLFNVTGYAIPFANDLMGLFPKYMSRQRGQFLCMVIGFAICPWKIEASPSSFLAFANGCVSPFIGSVAGVLLCDYFVVRRRSGLDVFQLYKPHGLYWYHEGWNMGAILAFLVGMVPQMPGLATQINPNISGISRAYVAYTSPGWLQAIVFSFLAYYVLCLLKPFPSSTDEEDIATWAVLSRETSQGVGDEVRSAGEIEVTYADFRGEA